MAEYYDMQEVAGKLRKTDQEVQELVKQGRLHQYMDSGKPVFKGEEVDALTEELVGLDVSSVGLAPDGSEMEIQLEETSEIQLEPDGGTPPAADDMELDIKPDVPGQKESEGGFGLSQMGDLTMADTNVGTVGINILSAGTEEGAGGADIPVDDIGLVDETEDLMAGGDAPIQPDVEMGAAPAAVIPAAAPVAIVDSRTAVFGVLMFLPMLALIAASIILTAASQDVVPALMKPLVAKEVAGVSLIWVIVAGLAALLLLIPLFASLSGGGGGGTKTKKTKAKKEKKPKKEKKAKKKRK
jgi:hypothetical protein